MCFLSYLCNNCRGNCVSAFIYCLRTKHNEFLRMQQLAFLGIFSNLRFVDFSDDTFLLFMIIFSDPTQAFVSFFAER